MKVFVILILFWLSIGCATPQKANSIVSGIDTFGSERVSAKEISLLYSAQIEKWVLTAKNAQPEFAQFKNEIETSIRERFDLAFVFLSLITYFPPNDGDYVTVDVVEKNDKEKRMAFLPQPNGYFEDPDGLIALWEEYFRIGVGLQQSGQFEYHKSCPVWHCVYGFENPKLAPFLEKFNRLVARNERKLVRILKQDARAEFRGNAAYLLAHLKNGRVTMKHVLGSVRDPSEFVRNNTVRVLSEFAWKHPEIDIPVKPILQVLDFPNTTDRNKAGYALTYLSLKEKNKKIILQTSGKTLLEMMKLDQPNNRQPAYSILKNISGEDFGERNYEAWKNWLLKNAKL